MIRLDIQLFGGRGASSSEKTIDGSPVVKSTEGYHFWNIGKNAPKGYIGLIKNYGVGKRGETAYIKSKYADEVANFESAGSRAMNYDNLQILDKEIRKMRNRMNMSKGGNRAYRRFELEQMERAREIRQKLGL